MLSNLELLEQRIVNFEAENAELKDENTKLRQIIGENAEHKARIEELEQILQPRMLNLRLEL